MSSSNWSESEKYQIVLEGLRGIPEDELLAKHGVESVEYHRWVDRFLASAKKGFSDEPDSLEICEDKLASSGDFSDLVNSIPHAVFCKDLEGRFTYGNPAYCSVVKVAPLDLVGMDDFALHTQEAAEKFRSDDRMVMDSGEVFSCQEQNVHVDGTVLWTEVVKAPIRDEEGNIIGVMGMFWDITKQKEIEKELRNSRGNLEFQVQKRTRELLEANSRLEEGVKLKNAFMSSVSHELRTPLTSVLGFAKLIDRDACRIQKVKESAPVHEQKLFSRIIGNAGIISTEGQRLKRLIDDLLDLEKIGSGNMTWSDEAIDLNVIGKASVEAMRGYFSSKPMVELSYAPASQPVTVFADVDRVKQVFINLLNNAAKFTDEGKVSVVVSVRGKKWAEVNVVDTGLGISKEEIAHIFEEYYQGVQPVIHEKGTGLGLPICNQIITHYGGKFWAESSNGDGTTFTFLLPLHS